MNRYPQADLAASICDEYSYAESFNKIFLNAYKTLPSHSSAISPLHKQPPLLLKPAPPTHGSSQHEERGTTLRYHSRATRTPFLPPTKTDQNTTSHDFMRGLVLNSLHLKKKNFFLTIYKNFHSCKLFELFLLIATETLPGLRNFEL